MKKNKVLKSFVIFSISILVFIFGMNFHIKADSYNENYEYHLTVNVDNPLTIQEIVEEIGLQAVHNKEDISDYIVCVNDSGYLQKVVNKASSFERELGNYELTFEVTSTVGVSSTMKIYVDVQDLTGPKIINEYSKMHYTFMKSDIIIGTFSETISNSILAFDNCSAFNVNKYAVIYGVDENSSTGVYNAIVYLSDEAGNETEVSISIEVVDDISIRFSMNSPFTIVSLDEKKYVSDIIEMAEIKAYNFARDELEISVKNDNDFLLEKTGIYILEFVATDIDGSSAIVKHIVNVVDTSEPEFSLDINKLYVVEGTCLSANDLETLIRMKVNDSREYVYEVINDQYSLSDGGLGQYEYEIELTYLEEDGQMGNEKKKISFVIEVLEQKTLDATVEYSAYMKTWLTIKKIGQIIIGIITWPISSLDTYF